MCIADKKHIKFQLSMEGVGKGWFTVVNNFVKKKMFVVSERLNSLALLVSCYSSSPASHESLLCHFQHYYDSLYLLHPICEKSLTCISLKPGNFERGNFPTDHFLWKHGEELFPGTVLDLFFWRGVRPEVWNPYSYFRIFLHQKLADLTVFQKFLKIGTQI